MIWSSPASSVAAVDATEPAAPKIIAGRRPANAMTMPMTREANSPTSGSTPATKEKAITSEISAKVPTMLARTSRRAACDPPTHSAR